MEQTVKPMDLLTEEHLKRLSGDREGPCVSMFMPTHQRGTEVQQDPIRLKNLLREAEAKLADAGARPSVVDEILDPPRSLVKNTAFWQRQHDGLALFLAPGAEHVYRLPHPFDELVVVGKRFYIKPLLLTVSGDERFFVLALSQNGFRLLNGTRYTMEEIDLEQVPKSLADVLKHYDFERSLQFHTGTSQRAKNARRGAVFHGHGGGGDETAIKEKVAEFLRKLDRGVCDLLGQERAPLILAGVEYVRAMYRQVSHYDHLLEAGIDGNPEPLGVQDLHRAAWTIVEPLFQERLEKWLDLYRQRAGSGDERAASDIRAVVPASAFNRVAVLLVCAGEQIWGTVDPMSQEVDVHASPQNGDEDLLNVAVVHTLRNGGTVYALEAAAMPDGGPVAAILR